MTMGEIREKMAEESHKSWAGWAKCMLECIESRDRAQHVIRWRRQLLDDYADLSEQEKESDRRVADRYLGILRPLIERLITAVEIHRKALYNEGHTLSEHEADASLYETLSELGTSLITD